MGSHGFEPWTSRLSAGCSTSLSYEPASGPTWGLYISGSMAGGGTAWQARGASWNGSVLAAAAHGQQGGRDGGARQHHAESGRILGAGVGPVVLCARAGAGGPEGPPSLHEHDGLQVGAAVAGDAQHDLAGSFLRRREPDLAGGGFAGGQRDLEACRRGGEAHAGDG